MYKAPVSKIESEALG